MSCGKIEGGFEYDCFCRRSVRFTTWPPRLRKSAKRKFWKRIRKEAKLNMKQEARRGF